MFLVGHSVAMVTYCVTKIIPTCSPMIGQFFDIMVVASTDKVWSWNVLELVLIHLNGNFAPRVELTNLDLFCNKRGLNL